MISSKGCVMRPDKPTPKALYKKFSIIFTYSPQPALRTVLYHSRSPHPTRSPGDGSRPAPDRQSESSDSAYRSWPVPADLPVSGSRLRLNTSISDNDAEDQIQKS